METRTDVNIPCGRLVLEGTLEYPAVTDGHGPGAVICHPHPLFGGNMHNNVVRAIRKGLLELGYVCLRFNFRGTGRSWGAHGGGKDEIQDVLAAMDFLLAQPNVDKERLLVAGYSFGCWVGLEAASRDARAKCLVGVSPPLNEYDFSYLKEELRPKFLIVGDNDFVCSLERFSKLMDDIPEPKMGVVLPGGDHFHGVRENEIIEGMTKFLAKYSI
jgi:alpha/beta superfamily hydrolase